MPLTILNKGKINKGLRTTMGMAASQARLLTLTSRLHDIEYKAQNIESQKIALATQKDEVYQAYCDALDAKKIQVAFYNSDGSKNFVDANFSTVCGYDSSRCTQYILTDAKTGKLIVDENTAEMYEKYESDKYTFAWAMVGFDGCFCFDEGAAGGDTVGNAEFIGGTNQYDNDFVTMSDMEELVFSEHQDNPDLVAAYDEIENAEDLGAKSQALTNFRDMLYKEYGDEIFNYMNLNKNDSQEVVLADQENNRVYDDMTWQSIEEKFNYYVSLYAAIQENGGCQVIEPQYVSGKEANEWFNNMVQSGRVLISEFNPDTNEWDDTSVATSTGSSYLQEVSDETDLKKAELEYERELSDINTKDTKFDNDLSKLETERTSITTEMESISKVRDDNIERTFGIFS